MQTKFTWTGFENREFCVDFKNEADKMEFLRECERREWLWESGGKPTSKIYTAPYSASRLGGKRLNHSSNLAVIVYNPHPIDCSIAENYIKERARMCNAFPHTCTKCPFSNAFDSNIDSCDTDAAENPQTAIALVQAWSDEHPIEPVVTYLDMLKEIFPNVKSGSNKTPCNFCPSDLGLKEIDGCGTSSETYCVACWAQPYKGE